MISRIIAATLVAVGIVAAGSAGWLIWQTPHCRMVPSHGYYTQMERC